MLALPMLKRDGRVDLLIVLEDDNIERIRQHDPAEIIWSQLPPQYANRTLGMVAVTYATAEEVKRVSELAASGKPDEAIQLVTRGFAYRPNRGDHDFGPINLDPAKRGGGNA